MPPVILAALAVVGTAMVVEVTSLLGDFVDDRRAKIKKRQKKK